LILFFAFLLSCFIAGVVQYDLFKLYNPLGHLFFLLVLFVQLVDGGVVDASQLFFRLFLVFFNSFAKFSVLYQQLFISIVILVQQKGDFN
jgi:hypothetical protein